VQIFNANASSAMGEIPLDAALPQVWVENPAHAAFARSIIDEFLRTSSTAGGVRFCPHCGEENPATFDFCWNCATGLEVAG
jgi:hypothetical protein